MTTNSNGNTTRTSPSVETITKSISYDLLSQLIVEKLYALSIIDDNIEVTMVDIDIPVDDNGMIEFDLEVLRY